MVGKSLEELHDFEAGLDGDIPCTQCGLPTAIPQARKQDLAGVPGSPLPGLAGDLPPIVIVCRARSTVKRSKAGWFQHSLTGQKSRS